MRSSRNVNKGTYYILQANKNAPFTSDTVVSSQITSCLRACPSQIDLFCNSSIAQLHLDRAAILSDPYQMRGFQTRTSILTSASSGRLTGSDCEVLGIFDPEEEILPKGSDFSDKRLLNPVSYLFSISSDSKT
jgi:hypothetical protein